MARTWIGAARYLFIPLVVEGREGYNPPPADYHNLVRRRVFYDPDPATFEDRSLSSYVNSISYGKAWLDAAVSAPITLKDLDDDDNPTLLAIYAHPQSHLYEYLAVVYPPNTRGAGSGMAQPGAISYTPPRTPNRTRARSRFGHDASLGTWAMEVMHNVTDIGDYYNGVMHPGRFDEMAAAAGTHPSAYTKLEAGWLSQDAMPRHAGGKRTYTLHAIGLPQPPPEGRVAGVRIPQFGSQRYLIVEARLKTDRWERGFSGSAGIPSEGVVIHEFAPASDGWARRDPNGPWPPLELRTPTALTAGQTYTHPATKTTVRVAAATPGGFSVEVTTVDVTVPFVQELLESSAATRVRAAGLQPVSVGTSGPTSWVWRQSPLGGTRVPPGSTVTLQLQTGPRP